MSSLVSISIKKRVGPPRRMVVSSESGTFSVIFMV